ncbi:MAG: hypothetical protein MUC92_00525 [Fimbriimonadaceae bacterium]|jgi:hypothetical protein|nr:hypothetical protein [Fimbriimonadaceae bacterium]
MKLALCRLCESADRLVSSGNPVLFGLFNRFRPVSYPAQLGPCCLAFELESEPEDYGKSFDVIVRLIDEDGRTLTNWRATLMPGPNHSMTSRTFEVLPVPWDENFVFYRPGRYRFDVAIVQEDEEDILGGEVFVVGEF